VEFTFLIKPLPLNRHQMCDVLNALPPALQADLVQVVRESTGHTYGLFRVKTEFVNEARFGLGISNQTGA